MNNLLGNIYKHKLEPRSGFVYASDALCHHRTITEMFKRVGWSHDSDGVPRTCRNRAAVLTPCGAWRVPRSSLLGRPRFEQTQRRNAGARMHGFLPHAEQSRGENLPDLLLKPTKGPSFRINNGMILKFGFRHLRELRGWGREFEIKWATICGSWHLDTMAKKRQFYGVDTDQLL